MREESHIRGIVAAYTGAERVGRVGIFSNSHGSKDMINKTKPAIVMLIASLAALAPAYVRAATEVDPSATSVTLDANTEYELSGNTTGVTSFTMNEGAVLDIKGYDFTYNGNNGFTVNGACVITNSVEGGETATVTIYDSHGYPYDAQFASVHFGGNLKLFVHGRNRYNRTTGFSNIVNTHTGGTVLDGYFPEGSSTTWPRFTSGTTFGTGTLTLSGGTHIYQPSSNAVSAESPYWSSLVSTGNNITNTVEWDNRFYFPSDSKIKVESGNTLMLKGDRHGVIPIYDISESEGTLILHYTCNTGDTNPRFELRGTGGMPNGILEFGGNLQHRWNGTYADLTDSTLEYGAIRTSDTITSTNNAPSFVNTTDLGRIKLKVGGLGTDETFYGRLVKHNTSSKDWSVEKVGAGTWTLGGDSDYHGGTTLTAGAIKLIGVGALGDNNVYFNGGELIFGEWTGADPSARLKTNSGMTAKIGVDEGETAAIAGTPNTCADFEKTRAGTLVVTNGLAHTGTTKISAGAIRVKPGVTLGTGVLTISSGARVEVDVDDVFSTWTPNATVELFKVGSSTAVSQFTSANVTLYGNAITNGMCVYNFTIDGEGQVRATYSPGALEWGGASGDNWDKTTADKWYVGDTTYVYADDQDVAFTDRFIGSAKTNDVNVAVDVAPKTITVDMGGSGSAYNLTGTGKITTDEFTIKTNSEIIVSTEFVTTNSFLNNGLMTYSATNTFALPPDASGTGTIVIEKKGTALSSVGGYIKKLVLNSSAVLETVELKTEEIEFPASFRVRIPESQAGVRSYYPVLFVGETNEVPASVVVNVLDAPLYKGTVTSKGILIYKPGTYDFNEVDGVEESTQYDRTNITNNLEVVDKVRYYTNHRLDVPKDEAGYSGSLTLGNGTILDANGELQIATADNSTGTVSVVDSAVLNVSGTTHIASGNSSTGTLYVADDATFDGGYTINVGEGNASKSSIVVDGGFLYAKYGLYIGNNKTLESVDDASMTIKSGTVWVDNSANTNYWRMATLAVGNYNNGGSKGRLDILGGDVWIKSYLSVGNGGEGLFNMSGGTLSLNHLGIGMSDAGRGEWIGSKGEFNMTGGEVVVTNEFYVGHGASSTGTVSITGGSLTCKNLNYSRYGGAVADVTIGGDALVTVTDVVNLGNSSAANKSEILNLLGGTLATKSIRQNNASTESTVVNLNGGTLKALQKEGDFLRKADGCNVEYIVGENGFTFDDGGYEVTIKGGNLSGSGVLTKKGMGTLTISDSMAAITKVVLCEGSIALPSTFTNVENGSGYLTLTSSTSGNVRTWTLVWSNDSIVAWTGEAGDNSWSNTNNWRYLVKDSTSAPHPESDFSTYGIPVGIANYGSSITGDIDIYLTGSYDIGANDFVVNYTNGTVRIWSDSTDNALYATNGTLRIASGTQLILDTAAFEYKYLEMPRQNSPSAGHANLVITNSLVSFASNVNVAKYVADAGIIIAGNSEVKVSGKSYFGENGFDGSITIEDGATWTANDLMSIGHSTGSTGNLNMKGASLTSETFAVAEAASSTGMVSVVNGDVTVNGEFRLANNDDAFANMTITNATVTVNSGWVCIGRDGARRSAILTVDDGGKLIHTVDSSTGNLFAIGNLTGDDSHNELVVNKGGYVSTYSDARIGEQGSAILTLNEGGVFRVATTSGGARYVIMNSASKAYDTTINLNGGTLETGRVTTGGSGTGSAKLLFNGGTLRAVANETLIANQSDLTVTVNAAGGTIDTNGKDVTVATPLLSGATNDGGLTKRGAGTLTLTSGNTFNGPVRIEGGTLNLPSDFNTTSAHKLILAGGNVSALTDWQSVEIVGGTYEYSTISNLTSGTITLTGGRITVDMSDKTNVQTGDEVILSKVIVSGTEYSIVAANSTYEWTLDTTGENPKLIAGEVYTGTTNYWVGAGADNSWTTAANWMYGVPTATQTVYFERDAIVSHPYSETLSVASNIVINANVSLSGSWGFVVVNGDVTGTGTLTLGNYCGLKNNMADRMAEISCNLAVNNGGNGRHSYLNGASQGWNITGNTRVSGCFQFEAQPATINGNFTLADGAIVTVASWISFTDGKTLSVEDGGSATMSITGESNIRSDIIGNLAITCNAKSTLAGDNSAFTGSFTKTVNAAITFTNNSTSASANWKLKGFISLAPDVHSIEFGSLQLQKMAGSNNNGDYLTHTGALGVTVGAKGDSTITAPYYWYDGNSSWVPTSDSPVTLTKVGDTDLTINASGTSDGFTLTNLELDEGSLSLVYNTTGYLNILNDLTLAEGTSVNMVYDGIPPVGRYKLADVGGTFTDEGAIAKVNGNASSIYSIAYEEGSLYLVVAKSKAVVQTDDETTSYATAQEAFDNAPSNSTIRATLDGEVIFDDDKYFSSVILDYEGSYPVEVGPGKIISSNVSISNVIVSLGTTTLSADSKINGILNIPADSTVTITNSAIVAGITGMTGEGRFVAQGFNPATNTAISNSVQNDSKWTGTVQLNQIGGQNLSIDFANYGNTNSTVCVNGLTGFLRFVANDTTEVGNVKCIEVIGDGLTLVNGFTSDSFGYIIAAKISGSGPMHFGTRHNDTSVGQYFITGDMSEFTGVIDFGDLTGYRPAVIIKTASEYAPAVNDYGQILVAAGRTGDLAARIASTWDAPGGLVVYGEAKVASTGVITSTNGVGGDGKLTYESFPTAAPTWCAGLTSSGTNRDVPAWTGTVELPARNGSGSLALASFGRTGSKIVLNGITGTDSNSIYLADDTAITAKVELKGNIKLTNGSSGKIYTFAEVTGTGSMFLSATGSSGTPYYTYTFTKLSDYTGEINAVKTSDSKYAALEIGTVNVSSFTLGQKMVDLSDNCNLATEPSAITVTVAGEATTHTLFKAEDGDLYVAVAYVVDGTTTNYYESAASAASAAEAANITTFTALVEGLNTVEGWDYSDGTFTKNSNIARNATTGDEYTSVATALAAAGEGETIVLFRNSTATDAVTIPTGVTLEVEQGVTFSGTVYGAGTFVMRADPNRKVVADNWTGTFVVDWAVSNDSGAAFTPANFGNVGDVNSKIVFNKEMRYIYFAPVPPITVPEIYLNANVSIKNGWGISGTDTRLTTFTKVGSTTNVTFSLRTGNNVTTYFAISDLNKFEGALDIPSMNNVTIAKVSLDEEPSIGEKVIDMTIASDATLTEPIATSIDGVSLVYKDDGLYRYVEGAYYWTGGGADNNWTTPANWGLTEGYPNAADIQVVFGNDATVVVDDSGAAKISVSNIVIAAGKTLTLSTTVDNFNVRGNIWDGSASNTNTCTMVLNGATIYNDTNSLYIYAKINVESGTANEFKSNAKEKSITLIGDVEGSGDLTFNAAYGGKSSGSACYINLYNAFSNFYGRVWVVQNGYLNKVQMEGDNCLDNSNAEWHIYETGAIPRVDNGKGCYSLLAVGTKRTYKFGSLNGYLKIRTTNNEGKDGDYRYLSLELGSDNSSSSLSGVMDTYGNYPNHWTIDWRAGENVVFTNGLIGLNNLVVSGGGAVEFTTNSAPTASLCFTNNAGFVRFAEGVTGSDISSLIKNSTAAIGFDDNGVDYTWETAIASSNTGGFTKKGAGTLTLAKAPTYTGETVVEEGTLIVPIGTAFNGAVEISRGATMTFAGDAFWDDGTTTNLCTFATDPDLATLGRIKFTGLNSHQKATFSVTNNNTLVATITKHPLVWNGEDGDDWSAENVWLVNSEPTSFEDGDIVQFTDKSLGDLDEKTVYISKNVKPSKIIADLSDKYTRINLAGNGLIDANGVSLDNSGKGSLALVDDVLSEIEFTLEGTLEVNAAGNVINFGSIHTNTAENATSSAIVVNFGKARFTSGTIPCAQRFVTANNDAEVEIATNYSLGGTYVFYLRDTATMTITNCSYSVGDSYGSFANTSASNTIRVVDATVTPQRNRHSTAWYTSAKLELSNATLTTNEKQGSNHDWQTLSNAEILIADETVNSFSGGRSVINLNTPLKGGGTLNLESTARGFAFYGNNSEFKGIVNVNSIGDTDNVKLVAGFYNYYSGSALAQWNVNDVFNSHDEDYDYSFVFGMNNATTEEKALQLGSFNTVSGANVLVSNSGQYVTIGARDEISYLGGAFVKNPLTITKVGETSTLKLGPEFSMPAGSTININEGTFAPATNLVFDGVDLNFSETARLMVTLPLDEHDAPIEDDLVVFETTGTIDGLNNTTNIVFSNEGYEPTGAWVFYVEDGTVTAQFREPIKYHWTGSDDPLFANTNNWVTGTNAPYSVATVPPSGMNPVNFIDQAGSSDLVVDLGSNAWYVADVETINTGKDRKLTFKADEGGSLTAKVNHWPGLEFGRDGYSTVIFDSGTYSFTDGSQTGLHIGWWWHGESPCTGRVDIVNADVSAKYLELGTDHGRGFLNMTGDGSLNIYGDIRLGANTTGSGAVSMPGQGYMDIQNGTLNVTGTTRIGRSVNHNTDTHTVYDPTYGKMTIGGGVVNNGYEFIVGAEGGLGDLVITNGALTSSGTVKIGTTETLWGDTLVAGTGTVYQTGGEINVTNSYFALAHDEKSYGEYFMSGGSLSIMGGNNVLVVGRHGDGYMEVSGEASVYAGGIHLGESWEAITSYGHMKIGGGEVETAGDVDVGYRSLGEGYLEITNGNMTVGGYLNIGRETGSTGTVEVVGGTLTANGNLVVGRAGKGNMTISDDAQLITTGNLVVGELSSGLGVMEVSGGAATVGGTVYIGKEADSRGTCKISGGEMIASHVEFGDSSASSIGAFTMTGGVFQTGYFKRNDSATAYLTFDGGVLQATQDRDNFFENITDITIETENGVGLMFDTGANNITFANTTMFTGGGMFTKLGSGSLTFNDPGTPTQMNIALCLAGNGTLSATNWIFQSVYVTNGTYQLSDIPMAYDKYYVEGAGILQLDMTNAVNTSGTNIVVNGGTLFIDASAGTYEAGNILTLSNILTNGVEGVKPNIKIVNTEFDWEISVDGEGIIKAEAVESDGINYWVGGEIGLWHDAFNWKRGIPTTNDVTVCVTNDATICFANDSSNDDLGANLLAGTFAVSNATVTLTSGEISGVDCVTNGYNYYNRLLPKNGVIGNGTLVLGRCGLANLAGCNEAFTVSEDITLRLMNEGTSSGGESWIEGANGKITVNGTIEAASGYSKILQDVEIDGGLVRIEEGATLYNETTLTMSGEMERTGTFINGAELYCSAVMTNFAGTIALNNTGGKYSNFYDPCTGASNALWNITGDVRFSDADGQNQPSVFHMGQVYNNSTVRKMVVASAMDLYIGALNNDSNITGSYFTAETNGSPVKVDNFTLHKVGTGKLVYGSYGCPNIIVEGGELALAALDSYDFDKAYGTIDSITVEDGGVLSGEVGEGLTITNITIKAGGVYCPTLTSSGCTIITATNVTFEDGALVGFRDNTGYAANVTAKNANRFVILTANGTITGVPSYSKSHTLQPKNGGGYYWRPAVRGNTMVIEAGTDNPGFILRFR